MNLIETSDAYCLDDQELAHNERLLARALEGRREGVTVVTTVGCRRPGGAWTVDSEPEHLVASVERSLVAQGAACLDMVMLYSPDKRIPYEDSVGALARLREDGKIRYVGVCNVDLEHLRRAEGIVPIQAIQNRWNPQCREIETNGLLDHCVETGKALMAYQPFGGTLGAPTLTTLGKLSDQARRRRLSPYQLVLSWMTNKAPVTFVVTGARRPESIEDSAGAGSVEFDADAVRAVENTLPQP